MRFRCVLIVSGVNSQLPGDLLIRSTAGNELDNRALAGRQFLVRSRNGKLARFARAFPQTVEQTVDELHRLSVFIERTDVSRLREDWNDARVMIEYEARHICMRSPRHELSEKMVGLCGRGQARMENSKVNSDPQSGKPIVCGKEDVKCRAQ